MTLAPNDFTHLHVHSEFSLLDGLGRITELVDAAAASGMDSMAITDHGALYGAVAFYQAAKNKAIKPIIGVETYVAPRSMTSKEGKADSQPHHLILLAKDHRGYQNLCRLVTDAHVEGYGGGGKTFNWSLLPPSVGSHLVLSGGLTPANVTDGIRQVRPRCKTLAVDVSSGVESAKGIKDAVKIHQFVAAVRAADGPQAG